MKVFGILHGEQYEGSWVGDTLYKDYAEAQKQLHLRVFEHNKEAEEYEGEPLKEVKPDDWFDGYEYLTIRTFELK